MTQAGSQGPEAAEIVAITGASSGIGEAVARRFARAGAKLVLFARRLDRLEKLSAELGVPCHVAQLDVADRAQVESVLSSLPEALRQVTVLVNSAGLSLGLEPAHQASLDDWETMVDTNVKGLLYMTRALLPGMVERDRGHVINIGSVAGTYPYPGGNVYGATKAFVAQLSLNLRADLCGKRVRVTDIEPGMVETEFSVVRFAGDQARADAVYRGMQPLTPHDIAEAVFWCASQPRHVNINRLELMPTAQAFSAFAVARS